MKKNEIMKRLSAIILAGTMTFAMGTSVFATEQAYGSSSSSKTKITGVINNPTAIPLTKIVTAGDNVKAPNTSFTFSVAPADQETDAKGVVTAYAGITDGLKFASGKNTITFTPSDTSFTKTTEISIDKTKFTRPGVYHYQVKETAGFYDGMTYDSTTYDVYVYVENDTNNSNGLIVSAVKSKKAESNNVELMCEKPKCEESKSEESKSDISFENTYTTNKLTLKKVITGNQAHKSKEFKFTLTINGAAGEKYTAVNGDNSQELTSGTSVDYYLGNDETVVIYGLSANDTYTIVEEDCSKDGYETTITGDGTVDATNKLKVTGTEGTADKAVTYTNTKQVNPPTGIITNVLPYVLMVVTAAGLAFVFLRKREYDR